MTGTHTRRIPPGSSPNPVGWFAQRQPPWPGRPDVTVRDRRQWTVRRSPSAIGITKDDQHNYLITLRDDVLYELSGSYNTCSWWFSREEAVSAVPWSEELGAVLNSGVDQLDDAIIELAGQVVPDGKYDVALLDLPIVHVDGINRNDYFTREVAATWPHEIDPAAPWDPKTSYYRSLPDDAVEGWTAEHAVGVFHLLLPAYEPERLDSELVGHYANRLAEGAHPTVLALTMLAHHELASYPRPAPDLVAHEIFAHVLLDGHHKAFAAATTGTPIRLLAFNHTP